MAISRSQLVKELEPGLNALFGLEYKNYENEHAEIYDIETSDRAFEEEVMLSGFGNAQVKAEGQGVSFDDAFTDERGLKIAARGMKLIIHPNQQFTAERLMESKGRTGTADNDINALVSRGMVPQGYVINHYVTDTDAFYIKTDVPNGMKMFNRSPIKTSMEGDFDTGNVRYKARERYSFGFSDPRGMYASAGA